MKATPSEAFHVDVAKVLKGARHLVSVAVVGVDAHGDVVVASSVGTPQTINLFKQAVPRIEAIAAG